MYKRLLASFLHARLMLSRNQDVIFLVLSDVYRTSKYIWVLCFIFLWKSLSAVARFKSAQWFFLQNSDKSWYHIQKAQSVLLRKRKHFWKAWKLTDFSTVCDVLKEAVDQEIHRSLRSLRLFDFLFLQRPTISKSKVRRGQFSFRFSRAKQFFQV